MGSVSIFLLMYAINPSQVHGEPRQSPHAGHPAGGARGFRQLLLLRIKQVGPRKGLRHAQRQVGVAQSARPVITKPPLQMTGHKEELCSFDRLKSVDEKGVPWQISVSPTSKNNLCSVLSAGRMRVSKIYAPSFPGDKSDRGGGFILIGRWVQTTECASADGSWLG